MFGSRHSQWYDVKWVLLPRARFKAPPRGLVTAIRVSKLTASEDSQGRRNECWNRRKS